MVIFGEKLKLYELVTLAALLFLILAIPLTVYLVKQQQILKSRAAGNYAGKIGIQIVCGFPNQAEFEALIAQNPRVIKLMDDFSCAGRIKEISPSTFIVGRIYDGSFDDKTADELTGGDPVARAGEYVSGKGGTIQRNPDVDCWEGPNEINTRSADEMARYSSFETERVWLLAGMGRRACVGNFGVGHPEIDQWPSFFGALQAARDNGGYLAVHEYSAPGMQCMFEGDSGWLTGRYRKGYRDYLQPAGLEIPLLITETGVDGGVCGQCGCSGGGGWRNVTDAYSYAEELKWYNSVLEADSYVIGATIFASGLGWSDFEPYPEIIGPQGLLISYEGGGPPPPGSPPPGGGGVTCNTDSVSLQINPATVQPNSRLNFTISGEASTFISDDFGGGAFNCSGVWNNQTCTAISQSGSYTWTHNWRHCEGSFDNCSGQCSKSQGYTIAGFSTASPTPKPSASPTPRFSAIPTPKPSPQPSFPAQSPSPPQTPTSVPSLPLSTTFPPLPPNLAIYDLNFDLKINAIDTGIFLEDWRNAPTSSNNDFNSDSVRNSVDYSLLTRNLIQ